MFTAEEAKKIGLVHEVVMVDELKDAARNVAFGLASKHQPAFASIKSLLRRSIIEEMIRREKASIQEFADIWYSETTWANLQEIRIHKA